MTWRYYSSCRRISSISKVMSESLYHEPRPKSLLYDA